MGVRGIFLRAGLKSNNFAKNLTSSSMKKMLERCYSSNITSVSVAFAPTDGVAGFARLGILDLAIMPPSIVQIVPVIHSLVIIGIMAVATSSTVPHFFRGKCLSQFFAVTGSSNA